MARREPMSSVDRAWLLMDDPTNPMVISGFRIFGASLKYEDVPAVLVDIRGPEDTKLTNRFALVHLPLPIGVADPIDRLFETKRNMAAIKQ
ncbi:MAG: DUF1298 domain-containing protein, partial [Caldilineaceae bacterium SB0675_bin_29]|nr:DUF1298 domain-containing protein [Caldilineaceae bacterium SB0675_bin_29]